MMDGACRLKHEFLLGDEFPEVGFDRGTVALKRRGEGPRRAGRRTGGTGLEDLCREGLEFLGRTSVRKKV